MENTPEKLTADTWIKIGFSTESKIGSVMNKTDLKLQAMAQKSIAKIKIPSTIAEIVDAEKLVIELRNDYTEITNERKKLTSKFDNAISRLMEPEKLILPAVKPLTDAILRLKKEAEVEANKVKYHTDELKRVKEQIATHVTNHDAKCKTKIVDLVDKAYSFALGNGDVKVEEIGNYISRLMKSDKTSEKEFTITVPEIKTQYVTSDEVKELWENIAMEVRSPMDYRQDLHDSLQAKFEFYSIAVKNKVESLKQAAIDREAEEQKILKEKGEAETANKLNSLSTVHNATPVTTHKDLKKSYIIDMVGENWNDWAMVVTAFVSNLEKCKEEIRVKNIWNLDVSQMAVALCKLKNKDENFSFGELKFKQVDKL